MIFSTDLHSIYVMEDHTVRLTDQGCGCCSHDTTLEPAAALKQIDADIAALTEARAAVAALIPQ